jgi:predicted dehydrogenase
MNQTLGLAALSITHPHLSVRLEVAHELDDIEIIGIADPDPKNQTGLVALAKHLTVPVKTEEELLADPAVHAVICEPWTNEMVDYSIRCLNAGKHVLIEKPGGLDVADLQRLQDAALTANRVVQVGYNFRFSPMVEFAKDVINRGLIGKVLQAQVHAAAPGGWVDDPWFNVPGDMGGTFWEDGCHITDLIVDIFGMPKRVSARLAKFDSVSDDKSLEDVAVATLEWDSMLMAFDFTAWEAHEWLESWQFNLYGTEGTLRFQIIPERFELYLKEAKDEFKKGWNRWDETTFVVPWAAPPSPWDETHVIANRSFFYREIAAFRDACLNGTEPAVSVAQAKNVAIVTQACYDSDNNNSAFEEVVV